MLSDAYRRWKYLLEASWRCIDAEFFGGRLPTPLFFLEEQPPDVVGYYLRGRLCATVCLDPRILDGTRSFLRTGSKDSCGLRRLFECILLHEAVHVWHGEVTGQRDAHFKGHGPAYLREAERITPLLASRMPLRKKAARPCWLTLDRICQWPEVVLKRSYFRGAYPNLPR